MLKQRVFGRGAAHVEGNDVFETQCFGIRAGTDAATDGTGFDQTDGVPARALRLKQSSVRTHHEERTGETLSFQVAVEPADIGADLRPYVSVRGYRGTALILVPLVSEIGAESDVDIGQTVSPHFGH